MKDIIIHHKPEQTAAYYKALVEVPEAVLVIDETIPRMLTVAARIEGDKLHIAYSACSWTDNFDRKEGRRKVSIRLGIPVTTFPVPEIGTRWKTLAYHNRTSKEVRTVLRNNIRVILKQYADAKKLHNLRKAKLEYV